MRPEEEFLINTLEQEIAKRRSIKETVLANPTKKSPAGLNSLDEKTVQAQIAAYADRMDPSSGTRARLENFTKLITSYVQVTIEGQQLWNEDRWRDENLESLYNALIAAEDQGFGASVELVAVAHRQLEQGAHIFYNRMGSPGGSLYLRAGERMPTVYTYKTPEEKQTETTQKYEAECRDLRKLSTEELTKLATAGRRYPKRGEPGNEGGWR